MRENFTVMLIRFTIDNILSFGEQKTFHTLPNKRLGTLKPHIYPFEGFDILKLSAIYGANGAGKSNLVQGLEMLRYLVTEESIPSKLKNGQFKFQNNRKNKSQVLAIEFVQDNTVFYYAIEIKDGVILTEELYESGLNIKADSLIFERKTIENNKTTLQFSEIFEHDEKTPFLKEVLLDFIKPNKPALKLISDRDFKDFKIVKKAYQWFETLTIIRPHSKPIALAHQIDIDADFKAFADDIMRSFNIGIVDLFIEKTKIEDFFGNENEEKLEELRDKVEKSPQKMMQIRRINDTEGIFLVKEKDGVYIKTLQLRHKGGSNITANFDMDEESDGTIRLLDFIPVFRGLVTKNRVFVIDEIERSIHPLLIKELLKKFSLDSDTKGQLIFTTHESNLLDQNIFRQDEIWFAEKDETGSTDLYSLSAFKEHKTIDIQRGYLNGRYGSIPFLGNLQELNWHNNAHQESLIHA